MKGSAASVLSGPAGYAVPILVGLGAVYVLYRILKGPVAAAAAGAYTGAQNFDQNVGLGKFDAWVSGLFSTPPTTPDSANLGSSAGGLKDFGTTGLGW